MFILSKVYPEISTDSQHIDALSAFFVTHPETFDVVVASNLFGDILSDIGAGLWAVSESHHRQTSMSKENFRRCSNRCMAPHRISSGKESPIQSDKFGRQKWCWIISAKNELGDLVLDVMESVIADGITTPDLGGNYKIDEVTAEIVKRLVAENWMAPATKRMSLDLLITIDSYKESVSSKEASAAIAEKKCRRTVKDSLVLRIFRRIKSIH